MYLGERFLWEKKTCLTCSPCCRTALCFTKMQKSKKDHVGGSGWSRTAVERLMFPLTGRWIMELRVNTSGNLCSSRPFSLSRGNTAKWEEEHGDTRVEHCCHPCSKQMRYLIYVFSSNSGVLRFSKSTIKMSGSRFICIFFYLIIILHHWQLCLYRVLFHKVQ